jgi:probable phosphoglycerate mutase
MEKGRSIWLLRHGATEWSRNGRHTGTSDIPLLPEGEQEAKALAPILAGHQFSKVLVSPLQRARRTCALAGLGEQAEICEDLREWNYGIYEGITTPEIRQTVPGWSVWSHGCPEGEDAAAVTRRCERVIATVLELEGDVALFAHGHILRSLAGTWIGQGAVGGKHLALGTATTSVLGFERENRVLLRWNAPCLSVAP